MSKNSERAKAYKNNLQDALKFMFGNECCFCGAGAELEFAHKKEDGMNGRGRGSYKRYTYIKNHPQRFLLLCHDCHADFDRHGVPSI